VALAEHIDARICEFFRSGNGHIIQPCWDLIRGRLARRVSHVASDGCPTTLLCCPSAPDMWASRTLAESGQLAPAREANDVLQPTIRSGAESGLVHHAAIVRRRTCLSIIFNDFCRVKTSSYSF
jgi:hypothetical protein